MKEEKKDLEEYYKELYEREKLKSEKLAYELADAKRECEDLAMKLSRIKDSPFWAMSKPFRVIIHFFIRQKNRILCHGNPKGIARKIVNKYREKRAIKIHGTGSFPTAAKRREEEETKFPKNIKISILVPLYNTPERFLREMIDSVVAQTYQNWELCLADGSDGEHGIVGEICKSYYEKDKRIVYKKLEKMKEYPATPMPAMPWQPENTSGFLTMTICFIQVFYMNM